MSEQVPTIRQYEPLFGSWHVVEEIGQGSFGIVYRVSREEMGQRYDSAVKLISIPTREQYREAESSIGTDPNSLSSYFEDIVKGIVGEVSVLHSLSGNTNIVAYHDHAVKRHADGVGWDLLIRMEFVTSLRKYLMEHRLTRGQAIGLGIDICTALEVCSKKGIIHRDIKDDNIFVSADGVFKLGDFGIARELSKSGRAASMRGTPYFMAPEVYRGDRYEAVVDICSLGLVLYKLMNNLRMPFMPPWPEKLAYADGDAALERRMRGDPLPMPALAGERLGQVILKACAYLPENRHASAAELRHELEETLAGMTAMEREEPVTPLLPRADTAAASGASTAPSPGMEATAGTRPQPADRTVGIFGQNERQQTPPAPPQTPLVESQPRPAVLPAAPDHPIPVRQQPSQAQKGRRGWLIALIAGLGVIAVGAAVTVLLIGLSFMADSQAANDDETERPKRTPKPAVTVAATEAPATAAAEITASPEATVQPTPEPTATEPPPTKPPVVVSFIDDDLRIAVQEQLHLSGDITEADAAAVESLVITCGHIKSLAGIEAFTSLKSLVIDQCYGQQASARIAFFKNVAAGKVQVNAIMDFTPLLALQRLETLVIFCNTTTDLTVIGQLKTLKHLRLSGQYIGFEDGDPIDDADAQADPAKCSLYYLSFLTNLEELDISRNYVRDFTPLQNLSNLKKLNVSNNGTKARPPKFDTLGKLQERLTLLTKNADWPLGN